MLLRRIRKCLSAYAACRVDQPLPVCRFEVERSPDQHARHAAHVNNGLVRRQRLRTDAGDDLSDPADEHIDLLLGWPWDEGVVR
ncbi:hypothetical protein PG997_000447 [Apiospora hydei]|uniref:Uncharacterized protein n=1 Tax=Apiospora hydei TaxID=1337664 RepID=A0ABR1XAS6_9PEZI